MNKKDLMKNNKVSDLISPFLFMIFAAICIQLAGRYHAAQTLVFQKYFFTLWVILRIAVPLVAIKFLKIPFSQVGLCFPKIDKKMLVYIGLIFFLLSLSFIGVYFYQDYLSSYSGSFKAGRADNVSRFFNFMIFTSSTLVGWEFLHRGFLLLGTKYILTEREGVDEKTAITIAIAIVWIFEVFYHFIKPELEAIGLLIGSPILSYIAIRSRSILLPFLIHLFVETLFIVTLIVR